MRFNPQGLLDDSGLIAAEPSTCGIGGGLSSGSGNSQQSSNSFAYPLNYQNPQYTNLAATTAPELQALQNATVGGIGNGGGIGGFNPWTVNGISTYSTDNPLVAQITPQQKSTLQGIGNFLSSQPTTLGNAFKTLQTEASPNFASSLATSPQTQSAIQAAINPIHQQFNAQTVPGLEGSFTSAGQRINNATGTGSSAFAGAFGNAQAAELANEGQVAGGIANAAYQTGLGITANAPAQIGALSSTELNQMISGLNAQALPQLTQQLGITAGTQLYQQQMQTILQALGLSVSASQPSLGYVSGSGSQGTGSSSSFGANLGISR